MPKGSSRPMLKLRPGAIREPHSHPNAEQLDYCISRHAQVGIVGPEGHKQLLELRNGDISFVPRGYVHWIKNLGTDELYFLVILSNEIPETIELSETLTGVPSATLSASFGLPDSVVEQLPKHTVTISAGSNM